MRLSNGGTERPPYSASILKGRQQVRRLLRQAFDPLTTQRLTDFASVIEENADKVISLRSRPRGRPNSAPSPKRSLLDATLRAPSFNQF